LKITNINKLDESFLYKTDYVDLVDYLNKKKFIHISKDDLSSTYIFIKSNRFKTALDEYLDEDGD